MGFEVFGVGVPEMIMILVVALIFLGPDKLPEAARTVGGWVREIRSLTSEATSMWQEALQVGETVKDSVQDAVRLDPPARLPPPPAPLVEGDAPVPLAIAYTPPGAPSVPAAPGDPAELAYPPPFGGPPTRRPSPEPLSYPAPFES